MKFLRPYAAQRLPFATDIAVDARAVWMTVGLSAATAVLIGMLPALSARRENLVTRLRGGAGGASDAGGIAQRRVRDTLVAIQFALAITVLIGTGLLVRSVVRVASVPLGFDPNGVVTFAIRPPRGKYDQPAQAAALYQRILTAVNAVPSVELSAAAGGALLPTKVETDEHRGAESAVEARYHPISTDFFRLRRIPIVAGRGFTDEDMRSPVGFVITQNLAKQLWPSGSPLGQRITVRRSSQARADFGQPITLPVVGVVADHREFGPETPRATAGLSAVHARGVAVDDVYRSLSASRGDSDVDRRRGAPARAVDRVHGPVERRPNGASSRRSAIRESSSRRCCPDSRRRRCCSRRSDYMVSLPTA